jgi:hypothetical protein
MVAIGGDAVPFRVAPCNGGCGWGGLSLESKGAPDAGPYLEKRHQGTRVSPLSDGPLRRPLYAACVISRQKENM